MVNELVPVRVDPNSDSREFWARYHAYRRQRHAEERPDEPVRPDELEESRLRTGHQFQFQYWYEMTSQGRMLGWFHANTMRPDSPGYDQNRHLISASASVDSNHRRRGVGSAWLRVLLELMDKHGCTVATMGTAEESGMAFLKWAGAQPKLTDRESRLVLAEVDWPMVERWVEEGAERSPQTKIEFYSGRVPESMWEDFSAQFARLLNTIPFENLDHGEIVITPAMTRDWYERSEAIHQLLNTVIARDADGTIVGITEVQWTEPIPELVEQLFTGVEPAARGRGIGKWIKAAMLLRIRELNPHARWVATGNAASNDPMLAINHRLGFKLLKVHTEFQITRQALAAKVASLPLGPRD